MKTKIIKSLAATVAAFTLGLGLAAPAFAECTDVCTCPGVSAAVKAAAGCPDTAPTADFSDTLIGILNGVIGILATVAVVVIIIGGIYYMTSNGDPGKVKRAKDTILYAVIGLIVCALAAVIVNFVVKTLILQTPATDDTETTSVFLKNTIAFFANSL